MPSSKITSTVSYTTLTDFIDANPGVNYDYFDIGSNRFVILHKNRLVNLTTTIANPSADYTDFENNYKAGADSFGRDIDSVNIVDLAKNKLKITQSGEARITNGFIEAPAGATKIVQDFYSNIAGTNDQTYTITNGKTLTISNLISSGAITGTGLAVELFEDPNGDKSVLNRIMIHIHNGNSNKTDLNIKFTGDGTRRILLRRRILGVLESGQVYARWEGYEKTT